MNIKYTYLKIPGIFILVSAVFISAAWLNACKNTATVQEHYFLNHHDTVDYVGIDACKQCHASHYESFIQTGMGKSFGWATMQKSSAHFQHHQPIYDSYLDFYYFPFWKDSQLFIKEFRLKNGDTVYSRTEKIHYIIGSGHHTNSHFYEVNGFIYQAPLTYYTQKKIWDLPPGYENGNNIRWSRKIDIECMSCHNAMPALQEGSVNKFNKVPLGIDCERCHGPGELHVNEKRKGKSVDVKKETDRTIVNPAKLPWKLQVDICQRCHLQGNNVLKPHKTFDDFKPGMQLSDVFEVFMPTYENKDYFVMAGHAERFQMSACFIKSNPKNIEKYQPQLNFTCINCHNPHVSVKQTQQNTYNQTCINCHNKNGASKLKKCSNNEKALALKNHNCVNCHMPASDTRDIPHVTVHDHFIRKTSPQNTPNSGKPTGLYAVNNKWSSNAQMAKAFLTWYEKFDRNSLYLDSSAKRVALEKEDLVLEVHFRYVNLDYKGVVALAAKMNQTSYDAWTAYRIGKSYDRINQLKNSLDWYEKAVQLQPLQIDFIAEYGNALIRSNKGKEAYLLLKKTYQLQPKHALISANLGRACMLMGNISEAQYYLKKSLSLDPDLSLAKAYLKELESGILTK